MRFDRKMLTLYAITDRKWVGKYTLEEQAEQALKGGITVLQLREKNMSEDSFLKEAVNIKKVCEKYNVPLIINDNVDIAFRSGADGVHVGIEDMAVSEIRKKAPEGFIIGATAKTVEQARTAFEQGADYLGVGAVFPSPTKTNAIRITNEQLNEICKSVPIPCVAIGGITIDNADELSGAAIDGIAVVSAVFGAEDIEKASRALRQKAEKIIE